MSPADIGIGPNDPVVSHEVTFTVRRGLADTCRVFRSMPLEAVLKGVPLIPSVEGTRLLEGQVFGAPGTRREVNFAGGYTALEEVLENQPESLFWYKVWNTTVPLARPVECAHGRFWFSAAGEATVMTWRYSFKLRPDRLPGNLGSAGRWLFEIGFVRPFFGRFMQQAATAMQGYLENTP